MKGERGEWGREGGRESSVLGVDLGRGTKQGAGQDEVGTPQVVHTALGFTEKVRRHCCLVRGRVAMRDHVTRCDVTYALLLGHSDAAVSRWSKADALRRTCRWTSSRLPWMSTRLPRQS